MGCDLNSARLSTLLILHGQYAALRGWEVCGWRKLTWLCLGQRLLVREGDPGAASAKAHLAVRGWALGLPASKVSAMSSWVPVGLLMEQGSCRPLPALVDASGLWAELRQIMCRTVCVVQDVPRQ